MDAHTEVRRQNMCSSVWTFSKKPAPITSVGRGWLEDMDTSGLRSPPPSNPPSPSGERGVTIPHMKEDFDSVYLGCWRRDLFERIGLFDEKLVRNQDDEFNLRLARSGGRVWQSPRIRSWYQPRSLLEGSFATVPPVRLLEGPGDPKAPSTGFRPPRHSRRVCSLAGDSRGPGSVRGSSCLQSCNAGGNLCAVLGSCIYSDGSSEPLQPATHPARCFRLLSSARTVPAFSGGFGTFMFADGPVRLPKN